MDCCHFAHALAGGGPWCDESPVNDQSGAYPHSSQPCTGFRGLHFAFADENYTKEPAEIRLEL